MYYRFYSEEGKAFAAKILANSAKIEAENKTLRKLLNSETRRADQLEEELARLKRKCGEIDD